MVWLLNLSDEKEEDKDDNITIDNFVFSKILNFMNDINEKLSYIETEVLKIKDKFEVKV